MNIAQAHASMITCAEGLGRLLPKACARRWKIANDVEPGDAGSTAYICKPCPDGQTRAELVQLKPRPKKANGRLNGASDRACRACGGDYKPASRSQQFCRRAECMKDRQFAAAKRYDNRRAKLHKQKPDRT